MPIWYSALGRAVDFWRGVRAVRDYVFCGHGLCSHMFRGHAHAMMRWPSESRMFVRETAEIRTVQLEKLTFGEKRRGCRVQRGVFGSHACDEAVSLLFFVFSYEKQLVHERGVEKNSLFGEKRCVCWFLYGA